MNISLTEKILLARLCYSLGVDYISDSEYDQLMYKQLSPVNPYRYFNSEDISVTDIDSLLKKADELGLDLRKTYSNYLKQKSAVLREADSMGTGIRDKSHLRALFPTAMSMQMANELSSITNDYLKQIAEICHDEEGDTIELHYSYKMDGWNIAVYYDPNDESAIVEVDGVKYVQPCYAHSRGSDGAAYTECTLLMAKLVPALRLDVFTGDMNANNTVCLRVIQVTGELTMRKDALSILNSETGKEYSNVRNTISGFVKGTIPLDYSYMVQFNAFKVCVEHEGAMFPKSYDNYCWLSTQGFYTPTGQLDTVSKGETVEGTYMNLVSSFEQTFRIFERYYAETVSAVFECDGLTLQPNMMSFGRDLKPIAAGNFGYGLVAIKAGLWYKKEYVSTIVRIHFSKSRVNRAPIAIVVPVASDLGQNIRTVPLLHIQNIIDNDVHVGDKIKFTYHSQQLVEFVGNLSAVERNIKRGEEAV